MALSDFLGDLGVSTGGLSGSGDFIQTLGIFVIVLAVVGFGLYWYLNKKSYTKTIIKVREINGIPAFAGEEKAREITLPMTSTKAFQTKSGIFLTRPSIESGKDRFIYFIRKDGEWVNVGLQNINKEMEEIGLLYDHTDMRMANASLKKLVEKNYKKSNWLKEWAPYIGFGILILMIGIAGFIIMGEAAKVSGSLQATADALTASVELLINQNGIAPASGVINVVS